MTAAPKFQPTNSPLEKSAPAWNRRIIVVDDEPAIVSAYQDILSPPQNKTVTSSRSRESVAPLALVTSPAEPEFQVTVAYSFNEALRKIHDSVQNGQPFAIAFFDILLGGEMDGAELAKQARQIDPHLYTVFVTAYSDRNVDSIAAFLGNDQMANWDYLNKPFTHGEILQKARNGVAMWNLRRERAAKENDIADLQRQLLENEKLSSIAAVSRGASHEFGNILLQIIGRAELSKNLPEKQVKEALSDIFKAAQKAGDILERFKNLTKTEGTRPHDLFQLSIPADEAVEILSHQIKVNNIKICRVKTAKVQIHGDKTGLFQVMVNLLINAIHAMPGSGQIDISIEQDNDCGLIRIRDYGSGVDPAILPRITQPFFTTKGKSGTGLGLAVCRDIIEIEHQGELKFRNHEIKGFEVLIRLPIDGEKEGSE